MPLSDHGANLTKWDDLSPGERSFFVGDNYLPLPQSHANRIAVLRGNAARDFIKEALYEVPGYSHAATSKFTSEKTVQLTDVWNDESRIQEVREWLYRSGIPYSTSVFLLYDNVVVLTDWKIVVRYWDAFAWSVGVEMVVVDSTKSWVCSFHHEEAITFWSYREGT